MHSRGKVRRKEVLEPYKDNMTTRDAFETLQPFGDHTGYFVREQDSCQWRHPRRSWITRQS